MTKIMDRLGNEIKEGQVMYFEPIRGLVTVTEVKEPGTIVEGAPGFLKLEMQVPFRIEDPKARNKDIVFGELMQVHHPGEGEAAQAAIDDILKGNPKHRLHLSGQGGG